MTQAEVIWRDTREPHSRRPPLATRVAPEPRSGR